MNNNSPQYHEPKVDTRETGRDSTVNEHQVMVSKLSLGVQIRRRLICCAFIIFATRSPVSTPDVTQPIDPEQT